MADVDLLVEVRNAGVDVAIQKIVELRRAGQQAGDSLPRLAASMRQAMQNVSSSTDGATGKLTNFRSAIKATGADAVSLSRGLKELESSFQRIAQTSPGLSASDRLARLGGTGGLSAGKEIARTIQMQREAFNADPVKDLMAVERQEQALLDARTQKLSAQKNVQNALWEQGLQKLTPVQRATERLTRAQQELATASKAVNQANIQGREANGRFILFGQQQTEAQTAALNQQAQAVRGVTSATNELNRAKQQDSSSKASDTGNAFQSSFSYFIIAGMAQQASQAIVGMGSAAITASSEIERAFADTRRTFEGTGAQLASLQDRLKALATETPVSIVDLAEIATLGNQLGIAAADIESFTTTIAQYTAVSGQSAEDASTAFGRISNLTGLAASEYSNLASAITYVARTTVATESTIQNTAKEITALASGAGLSAQSIVGLAGALSSLAIPPERARGALSLYFGALNGAVAEGGPKLAAFAQLTRLTSDQLQKMVSENRGEEVFTAFIQGLSELDTVAKTTALDTLGLSTIRVDQTMRALAQNVPLLTQSLQGANMAFEENTEIAAQYGIIQETLASKIIEFQNAIQLASGAVGDALAPAMKSLLDIVTDILVNFTSFAESPFGPWVIGAAGAVTTLLLVMASLIGAVAILKATMVVIPWAMTGLGAKTASNGIIQFIAAMFGMNLSVVNGTTQTTKLSGALMGVGASSRAASLGFGAMRLALIGTGIGAAAVLIGSLVAALDSAGQSAKLSASEMTGLSEAIKTDTETYNATGAAIATFSQKTAGTTEEQKRAAIESKNWANVLGTDLVAGANAASDAISKIAAGDAVVEQFRAAIGENQTVKDIIKDGKFSAQWQSLGFNMTELIAEGIKSGGSEAAIRKMLLDQLGPLTEETITVNDLPVTNYYDAAGNRVTDFRDKLLQLVPVLASEAVVMQDVANSSGVLQSGLQAVDVDPLGDGFRGATDSLAKFQDAVSAGVSKNLAFGDILSTIKDKAKTLADEMGDETLLTSMVNATEFGAELGRANTEALTFFTDITALAGTGATSFATQLASLGPEAQAVLSSALAADPSTRAAIETEARLAAFLASDAFKTAFNASMQETNDAYARIFMETGDISQVQGYIAAQVAGTAEEWERQWAINHPEAPLNVTPQLMNPSDADIGLWEQVNSGRLKITVTPTTGGSDPLRNTQTITDTLTGASIVLPASLDGAALSQSVAEWQGNQNATPADLASKLNTSSLSADLNAWRDANGPVTVYARIVPLNTVSSLTTTGLDVKPYRNGGEVMPHFSAGGGFRVRGSGSGTQDKVLSALSPGEFVNTNDARRFWGTDFFDSLNRKQLPSSFASMLGAAAVSGNRGPQNVTNVSVTQINPVTRDPLAQLREDSENVAAGIW